MRFCLFGNYKALLLLFARLALFNSLTFSWIPLAFSDSYALIGLGFSVPRFDRFSGIVEDPFRSVLEAVYVKQFRGKGEHYGQILKRR